MKNTQQNINMRKVKALLHLFKVKDTSDPMYLGNMRSLINYLKNSTQSVITNVNKQTFQEIANGFFQAEGHLSMSWRPKLDIFSVRRIPMVITAGMNQLLTAESLLFFIQL